MRKWWFCGSSVAADANTATVMTVINSNQIPVDRMIWTDDVEKEIGYNVEW